MNWLIIAEDAADGIYEKNIFDDVIDFIIEWEQLLVWFFFSCFCCQEITLR